MWKVWFLSPILLVATSISPSPHLEAMRELTFRNGTASQIDRMLLAAARFDAAGLHLPPVEVSFHEGTEPCRGHLGLFRPGEVLICTDHDFIYEHELAHAWIHANDDPGRQAEFMAFRNHDNWLDPSRPWNERGGEDAAFIIQHGLLDQPLPPQLNGELRARLTAFEILTGRQSPRIDPLGPRPTTG